MDFPDRVVIDDGSKKQPLQKTKTLISKADEFFQRKVPLVDVMHTVKEIKEYMPMVHKMERQLALQEDRITALMLLNDRTCS